MAEPELLTTGYGTSNPASTASIAPTANRWVYVFVAVSVPGGWQTTSSDTLAVSGCNLTWEQVDAVKVWGSRRGSYVWRGKAASPASGALTITFSPSQGEFEQMKWAVVDMVGVDETTPNGTVATVANVGTNWAASGLGTPDTGDLAIAFICLEDNNTITWNGEIDTEVSQFGDSTGARRFGLAFDSAPDSTPAPGGSWTSTTFGGIAFILNAAAGGGTPQELAGVVDADAAAVGALSVGKPVAGSAAATSSAAGAAQAAKLLAGSAAAQSTISGAASADKLLAGTVAAASTVAGALAGGVELAGNASAQSVVVAALEVRHELSGAAPAQSVVAGAIEVSRALAGLSSATSTAAGAVQHDVNLSGAAPALSDVEGWLSAGGAELEGVVAAQSTLAAALLVQRYLSGEAPAEAALAGALTVIRALGGRVDGISTLAGAAVALKELAGRADAVAILAGDLQIGEFAREVIEAIADSCGVLIAWGESKSEITAPADSCGVLAEWAR